ncbi:hypothetical protein QBC44DRAFT_36339 [Cladorrhinum sp. PSN332]|nr:hypothetical protein QBC44DRAFT_36339 [Cladorrhinum sp. PSN332]
MIHQVSPPAALFCFWQPRPKSERSAKRRKKSHTSPSSHDVCRWRHTVDISSLSHVPRQNTWGPHQLSEPTASGDPLAQERRLNSTNGGSPVPCQMGLLEGFRPSSPRMKSMGGRFRSQFPESIFRFCLDVPDKPITISASGPSRTRTAKRMDDDETRTRIRTVKQNEPTIQHTDDTIRGYATQERPPFLSSCTRATTPRA